MKILYGYSTNVGKRRVNQDAFCIKEAHTNKGVFCMIVICDGMGGFSSGEIASSTMVKVFSEWFENNLPALLTNFSFDQVHQEWNEIAKKYSQLTVEYGLKQTSGGKLGTTLTAVLFTENYGAEIMQIGDTRLYLIRNGIIKQVTTDQTKVASIKSELSEYEYEHHPESHVLTDCIGGSRIDCYPNFYKLGVHEYEAGTVAILCTDGFRHEIKTSELNSMFSPHNLINEEEITKKIQNVINLVLDRGETDNISSIVMKFV